MSNQGTPLSEALITGATCVGILAGVQSLMNNKAIFCIKALLTYATHIRPFIGVQSLMTNHVTFVSKTFSRVYFKVAFVTQGFCANSAAVGPPGGTHFLMSGLMLEQFTVQAGMLLLSTPEFLGFTGKTPCVSRT